MAFDFNVTGNTKLDTSGFTDGISSMTVAAGNLIADFVKTAGSKLAELATSSVDIGAAFETSLSKVSTIADTSKVSVGELNKQILDTSGSMGVAAADIAEAAYQAISAGQDTANAVAFAGQASKLAAAGFTSSSSAVDILTTALNAYGMSTEQATHVSDVLLTTQNLGKTSVDELSSSMGRVIPLAAAYGISVENLSSSLAVMTANGIATAEATTYTKSMLNELGDTGSAVGKILQQQTGKSFSQLNADGKSLGDVLQILYDSVNGDSTAFAGLWSSVEAGTGALSLASGGAEHFNDVLSQMQNSAGATETAYEIMTDTFQHKVETMQTAAENLGITLYDSLEPALSNAAQWGTDIITQLTTALDEGGPEALLAAAREIISDLATGIAKQLPGLMQSGVEIVTQLTQGIVAATPQVLSVAASVLGALAQGISENLPELLVCAARIISELATYLGDHADDILDSGIQLLESLIVGITTSLPQLITAAAGLIAKFAAALISHLPDILECGAAILTTLGAGIARSAENLAEAALACVAKLVGVWDGNMDDFGHIGENIVSGLLNGILRMWGTLLSTVQEKVSGMVSTVKNLLGIHSPSKVFSEIGLNICKGLAEGLTSNEQLTEDAAKDVVASVTGTTEVLSGSISSTTQTVTAILKDGTEQQKQVITEAYDDVVDGALVTIERIKTIAADGTVQIAEQLQKSSADTLDGLWKELLTRAEDGMLGTFDDLYSAVKDKDWKSIGLWMAKAIYGGLSADRKKQIEDYALRLIDQLNGMLGQHQQQIAAKAWDIGTQICDGLTHGFSDVWQEASQLGNLLTSTFQSLKDPLSQAALAISQGLSGGLLSSFPSIYAGVAGMVGTVGAAFEAMLTAVSAALNATIFGIPMGIVVAGAAVALGLAIAAICANLGGSKKNMPTSGGGSSSSGGGPGISGDIDISTGTGSLEDAINANTKALTQTNAALADMIRQAGSLVLSDNMRLGSTVAASGTAQVAAAASNYRREGDTNITQIFYNGHDTAAAQQREARWEADKAKARRR